MSTDRTAEQQRHTEFVDDLDTLDVEAGDESKPFVPKGEYDAYANGAAIKEIPFGKQREERFIISLAIRGGQYDGTVLFFYATVPPIGHNGRRRPAPDASRLYRAWIVANGGRKPRRGERPRFDLFRHKLFRIRVREVHKDRRQGALPHPCYYSVVDALLERIA